MDDACHLTEGKFLRVSFLNLVFFDAFHTKDLVCNGIAGMKGEDHANDHRYFGKP